MRDRGYRKRWYDFNNVYRYRNDNLERLGFSSYAAYLRSIVWKTIRARVLAANPKCVACRKRPSTQVHHRAYDPKTLAGEDDRSLMAVCARCHTKAEKPDTRRPSIDRLHEANAALLHRKPRRRKRERTHASFAPCWAPRLVKPEASMDTRQAADEFDQLWDAHPRPTQRPKAHLQFLIARKAGATLAEMLDALAWQCQTSQWLKDDGAYVPSLVNWLKDERWKDRRPEQPQVSAKTARTLAAVAKWAER